MTVTAKNKYLYAGPVLTIRMLQALLVATQSAKHCLDKFGRIDLSMLCSAIDQE